MTTNIRAFQWKSSIVFFLHICFANFLFYIIKTIIIIIIVIVIIVNVIWKIICKKIMNKVKQTPEDIFFENATLGLARTLANIPRICDLRWERRSPCEKSQLLNWEQRHCVYLPDDMKKFYLSTDGFALLWSFRYGPSDIRRVGMVQMPHLMQITLLRENVDSIFATLVNSTTIITTTTPVNAPVTPSASRATSACTSTTSMVLSAAATTSTTSYSKDRWGHATPILTCKTKIFEINNINNVAKVCLLYECTGTNNPKIYLLELCTYNWHFLADTFTEYLRMSIAHLGLPYWELCFSNIQMPAWTEQLYLLLAPHLLHEHTERRGHLVDPAPEHPHNILDPNVFRARPKGNKTQATSVSTSAKTITKIKNKE